MEMVSEFAVVMTPRTHYRGESWRSKNWQGADN